MRYCNITIKRNNEGTKKSQGNQRGIVGFPTNSLFLHSFVFLRILRGFVVEKQYDEEGVYVAVFMGQTTTPLKQ